jgi:hypothetical protein
MDPLKRQLYRIRSQILSGQRDKYGRWIVREKITGIPYGKIVQIAGPCISSKETEVATPEDLLAYFDAMSGGTNNCTKCNENFPYAEPTVGFTCWGCKNGY